MKKWILVLLCIYMNISFGADRIAEGKEKSSTCIACHGENGISNNPEWPSLAGQHAEYLFKQLQAYKEGKTRNAPMMAPIVAELTEEDMRDLAAYYASLRLPEGVADKDLVKRGEAIYRGGDYKKHITACIACHGPKGEGNAEAGFPALSGQQVKYTIGELQDFKKGDRSNDLNDIMQDIAKRMSLEDMQAVASYIAGLH